MRILKIFTPLLLGTYLFFSQDTPPFREKINSMSLGELQEKRPFFTSKFDHLQPARQRKIIQELEKEVQATPLGKYATTFVAQHPIPQVYDPHQKSGKMEYKFSTNQILLNPLEDRLAYEAYFLSPPLLSIAHETLHAVEADHCSLNRLEKFMENNSQKENNGLLKVHFDEQLAERFSAEVMRRKATLEEAKEKVF